MTNDFSEQIKQRLQRPLPGRASQARFAPRLCYGRHFGPMPRGVRHASVVLLLYPDRGEWHMPLTVRPNHLKDHGGQISLPGGSLESNESPEQAALRELQEEVGISPGNVRLLGNLTPLYLFISDFYVTPIVASMRAKPSMTPNPAEVDVLFDVPVSEMIDSKHWGQHTKLFAGSTIGGGCQVPHIEWRKHRIWGATAMILGEFIAVITELQNQ